MFKLSSFHFATHDNLSGIVRVYVGLKDIYFKVFKFIKQSYISGAKVLLEKSPVKFISQITNY